MRPHLLLLTLLLSAAPLAGCVTAEGNGIPHAGPSEKEAYTTGTETAAAATLLVEQAREAERTGLIYASSGEPTVADPATLEPPPPGVTPGPTPGPDVAPAAPQQTPPPMRVRPEGLILGMDAEGVTLGLRGDGPLASPDARPVEFDELTSIVAAARKGDDPVEVVVFADDDVTQARRAELEAALKAAGADAVRFVGDGADGAADGQGAPGSPAAP